MVGHSNAFYFLVAYFTGINILKCRTGNGNKRLVQVSLFTDKMTNQIRL